MAKITGYTYKRYCSLSSGIQELLPTLLILTSHSLFSADIAHYASSITWIKDTLLTLIKHSCSPGSNLIAHFHQTSLDIAHQDQTLLLILIKQHFLPRSDVIADSCQTAFFTWIKHHCSPGSNIIAHSCKFRPVIIDETSLHIWWKCNCWNSSNSIEHLEHTSSDHSLSSHCSF